MKGCLLKVKLEVCFRPMYECSICHVEGLGDPTRYESNALQTELHIKDIFHPADHCIVHAMPVGWAHYGDGVYKCPDCVT